MADILREIEDKRHSIKHSINSILNIDEVCRENFHKPSGQKKLTLKTARRRLFKETLPREQRDHQPNSSLVGDRATIGDHNIQNNSVYSPLFGYHPTRQECNLPHYFSLIGYKLPTTQHHLQHQPSLVDYNNGRLFAPHFSFQADSCMSKTDNLQTQNRLTMLENRERNVDMLNQSVPHLNPNTLMFMTQRPQAWSSRETTTNNSMPRLLPSNTYSSLNNSPSSMCMRGVGKHSAVNHRQHQRWEAPLAVNHRQYQRWEDRLDMILNRPNSSLVHDRSADADRSANSSLVHDRSADADRSAEDSQDETHQQTSNHRATVQPVQLPIANSSAIAAPRRTEVTESDSEASVASTNSSNTYQRQVASVNLFADISSDCSPNSVHLAEPEEIRGATKFSCPECHQILGCESSLRRHMLIHEDVVYSCQLCGLEYKRQDSVRRHQRKYHPYHLL